MRLLTIPASIAGIALAIVFFKVYGIVARPAVPRPIAVLVDQFAPGVQLGAKVADARHSVAAMTYVPHLGFVGMPGHRDGNLPNGYSVDFAQVRLLLDEKTRRQANPDPSSARIDAVEVVSADANASSDLATAFLMLFRRQPRAGCLRTSEEGHLRDVQVWPTPNERGGVALISEYLVDPTVRPSGPRLTSVVAFTGKFEGGRTLRGNYTDAGCTLVLQSQ
jgi:hypothetical protein